MTFQILLVYLIIIGSIFSLYLNTNKNTTSQLELTQGPLQGLEYLESIYKLSLSLSYYKESLEGKSSKIEKVELKKEMFNDIDKLYHLLDKYLNA